MAEAQDPLAGGPSSSCSLESPEEILKTPIAGSGFKADAQPGHPYLSLKLPRNLQVAIRAENN